jgi:toxin YoeB
MKGIHWTERAWSDYVFWQENDLAYVSKINGLIKECLRTPFVGTGRPEPLKGELSGFWSRRISSEHRFVYQIKGKAEDQILLIIACRFHYEKLGRKTN